MTAPGKEIKKESAPKPSSEEIKKKTAAAVAALEDDDAFEDFPAEAWETTPGELDQQQLWDDTWEDEDTSEDFAAQLKQQAKELNGVAPMRQ